MRAPFTRCSRRRPAGGGPMRSRELERDSPMARFPIARFLSRCLPGAIRKDLFEPAVRDLETQDVAVRGSSGARPSSARITLRVLWLFVDCWRLAPGYALERRRDARLAEPRPSGFRGRTQSGFEATTARRERLTFMLVYHVRHALRLLIRERGFSAAAILTLALGIGANVAVFAGTRGGDAAAASVPERARAPHPQPPRRSDRLHEGAHRDRGLHRLCPPGNPCIESLDAFGNFDSTMYGPGEPFRARGLSASPRLFETLRVTPVARPRRFARKTRVRARTPVMMIGYDFWQTHFGGDPGVIGRSIRLELDHARGDRGCASRVSVPASGARGGDHSATLFRLQTAGAAEGVLGVRGRPRQAGRAARGRRGAARRALGADGA